MLEDEVWVVQHSRYVAPSYQRLYGPFASGDDAAQWASAANLPDLHIALRVLPPSELSHALAELQRNGQLTSDGRSLDGVSTNEYDAIARVADETASD